MSKWLVCYKCSVVYEIENKDEKSFLHLMECHQNHGMKWSVVEPIGRFRDVFCKDKPFWAFWR